MTGFLQRLAQRANGTARTVRAASGMRFAPEPIEHGAPIQGDALAPEASMPRESAGSNTGFPTEMPRGRFPSPVFAPADARRQQAAEAPRHGQATTTLSTPAPLLAPADETGVAHSPAPAARAARAGASLPNPRTPDPVDDAPTARGAPPGTGEPSTPRPDATPAAASPESSPASSTAAAPAWPQVEPLLAPTIRVRRPASAAQPSLAHRPGQSSHADTTTEVHVSIGRIEVTAIHEPAAPAQRPATRRKAPVSLDEYLARRQGGRS